MKMIKERLEEYRSNKEEIKELQYKLAHLGEGDSLIGNSVILDYRKGYAQPQSVVGYDYDLERSRKERWEKRLEELQTKVNEVESWIEAIPNGQTRRCFRMVYMDGLTQKQAGEKLHLDRSTISKKIDGFLKVSHNSQKSHL